MKAKYGQVDIESLVKEAREKYPRRYQGLSDRHIYLTHKEAYPDAAWPEFSPYDINDEINPNKETVEAKDKDYSPSTFEKIALAGLPEVWADQHDWAKEAYNNSIAGMTYTLLHGKPKYKIEDYDREHKIWEDALGFFTGIVSAPDLGLFLGSGGVGGVASKRLLASNVAQRWLKNGIAANTSLKVLDKKFGVESMVRASLDSGISLGMYGAAGGATAEATRQVSEGYEDLDYSKIVGEGVKAGGSGAIIGAAAGGVTKGVMANKFARAARAAKKGNNTFNNVATRILTNPASQVGAEAGLFTTGQLTEASLLHGQDLTTEDIYKGLFNNLAIIGGLRLATKPLRIGQNDMSRYEKRRLDYLNKHVEKFDKHLNEISKQIKGAGIEVPRELIDEQVKLKLETNEQKEAFDFIKSQEKSLHQKLGSKNFKNLKKKDQIEALKQYLLLNNFYTDMYSKLKKNPDLAYEIFEKTTLKTKDAEGKPIWKRGFKPKRPMTDAEKKAEMKRIDSHLETHGLLSDLNGKLALNDKKGANKVLTKLIKKGYIDKSDVASIKGKPDSGYGVALEGDVYKWYNAKGERGEVKISNFKDDPVFGSAKEQAYSEAAAKANPFGSDKPKGIDTAKVKKSDSKKAEVEPKLEDIYDANKLLTIAEGQGVPKETINRLKGKGIETKENPEGYDLAGLRDAINIQKSAPSQKLLELAEPLISGDKKPNGISQDAWVKNTALKNNKRFLEVKDRDNRKTILFAASRYLEGNVRSKAINSAIKFAQFLEKNHPFAKLSSSGAELEVLYKNYIDYIRNNLKKGKGETHIKGYINSENSGLRAFYKNTHKFLQDNINPIPSGKEKVPTAVRKSIFVGEYLKEETRNPELEKLANKYSPSGKGTDVIISNKGKPYSQKARQGKEVVIEKDMMYDLLTLARVLRPRSNEFTKTKIRNINHTEGFISLKRHKTEALDIVKIDKSISEYLKAHQKKHNLKDNDYIFFAIDKGTGKKTLIRDAHIQILLAKALEGSGVKLGLYKPTGKGKEISYLDMKGAIPDDWGGKKLPLSRLFRTFLEATGSEKRLEGEVATLPPQHNLGHSKGTTGIIGESYNLKQKGGGREAGTLAKEESRIDRAQRLVEENPEYIKLREQKKTAKGDKRIEISKAMDKMEQDVLATIPVVSKKGKGRETMLAEKENVPAPKEWYEKVVEPWLKKKYPEYHKKLKFVDELPPNVDGKTVLADLMGHTIRVVQGKAPKDAIPHEIMHSVFHAIKAIGSPRARQLLKQVTRDFGIKGSDEGAAIKVGKILTGSLEKGLIPKVKRWSRKINIFFRDFFGSPLRSKDAAFLLSEIGLKRDYGGIGGAVKVTPQDLKRETMIDPKDMGNPNDLRLAVRSNFQVAAKNFKGQEKQLRDYLLKSIDPEGRMPSSFKKLLYSVPENMDTATKQKYFNYLLKFNEALESADLQKFLQHKKSLKFFDTIKKIEHQTEGDRVLRNITVEKGKQMLLDLGVKDGEIWNATQKQLNEYRKRLEAIDLAPVESTGLQAAGAELAPIQTKYKALLEWGGAKILPVIDVIDALGLKQISHKLRKHVAIQSTHYGDGLQKAHYDMSKGWTMELPMKNGGVNKVAIEGIDRWTGKRILTGITKLDELKDLLSIADKDGGIYLENIKWLKSHGSSKVAKDSKPLSAQEIKLSNDLIKFFENAILMDKWNKTIKKDGKSGDALNAVDKTAGEFKYINLNTPEGRMLARYAHPTEGIPAYFEKAYKKSLKQNLNEAQYESVMKSGDVKWIKNGVYIHRSASDAFRKIVDLNSVAFDRIVNNQSTAIARKLAKDRYKVMNPSTEQINEFLGIARGIAIGNVHDANFFSINKFSTKFLMKRHPRLDLFTKDDNGNWIRTYNTSYNNTVKKYALGMSHYIAGIETFPEFTKVQGSNLPVPRFEIESFKKHTGEWSDWVSSAINDHIGVGQKSPFNLATSALQNYSNILAKTQLSNPLSGVKNAFLATTQAAWAYDVADIGRGIAETFKEESRIYVTRTGAKHMGTAHYEGGKLSKALDATFFRWGLMKPTENWARNFSVLTGRIDQRKHIDLMRNNPKGSKLYNKGKNRLERFYELDAADIDLLYKFGYGHGKKLEGHKLAPQNKYERSKLERRLEVAHQNMNHMAHIKTQGTSISLFMPKGAEGKFIKPMTLFKRMAYAASTNTIKNAKEAKQSGNYMKLATGTMATYFTGQALFGLYSQLLGTDMPKENSSWWKQFWTNMWRGEFLGIMSEFLNPFGASVTTSIYPAMFSNAGVLARNLYDVAWNDSKFVWGKDQAVDSYLKQTLGIYNAAQKVIHRRNNPYARKSIKFDNLYTDFEKEIFDKNKSIISDPNIKTKYVKDLKNAFSKGSAKEFAKAFILTYYVTASEYYNKGFKKSGIRHNTLDEAFKKADSQMKRYMTLLNPTHKPSKDSERSTKAKYIAWLNWLGKDKDKGYLNELAILGNEYERRMNEFKALLPYYIRKNNLTDLAKEFKWLHKI
tara:strand:- start:888 stop:8375 length:7488 start_codon:yes stop_codon:yes gene_type:complete